VLFIGGIQIGEIQHSDSVAIGDADDAASERIGIGTVSG
jgi:hypothetical protein